MKCIELESAANGLADLPTEFPNARINFGNAHRVDQGIDQRFSKDEGQLYAAEQENRSKAFSAQQCAFSTGDGEKNGGRGPTQEE